jgi:hypothetical protein
MRSYAYKIESRVRPGRSVVIQLITCDISSLSLYFLTDACRRPFADIHLQTSICRRPFAGIVSRHLLYIYPGLLYTDIHSSWLDSHSGIKQVVSD